MKSWYSAPSFTELLQTAPHHAEKNLSDGSSEEQSSISGLNPMQRRKYASRACAFCRSLHKKCDGGQPCVRCEQRKQECVYQKHKKRGPKPKTKSLGGKNKSKKRGRSGNLNGNLKGKTKRRKLADEYEDDDDDEDYEIGESGDNFGENLSRHVEPRVQVQVWIVMAHQQQISLFFDSLLTIENVKQYLIDNRAFGIHPHTHPSMVHLSLQEQHCSDRKVHPSTTLGQLLHTIVGHPEINNRDRVLIFTISVLTIKPECYPAVPIEEICQRPVPLAQYEIVGDPSSGWSVIERDCGSSFDLNVEYVPEPLPDTTAPSAIYQQQPPQPLTLPFHSTSNFSGMSSCDVELGLEDPNYFFSEHEDLDIQHLGWENPNKVMLY